jgi:hypothetical protein
VNREVEPEIFSTLFWILVALFFVSNVQAGTVRGYESHSHFFGKPYPTAKWLIPNLTKSVLKNDVALDEKCNFFQVLPFEFLFLRDFNRSHNGVTFPGRNQTLPAYFGFLVRTSVGSKCDKNTVQYERQISRIYYIKLGVETQFAPFWHPDPNRAPVFYHHPLPQIDFLQPDALFRSLRSYPRGFSLVFNRVQRLDSNKDAPDGNNDQRPIRYERRKKFFGPVRLIRLCIGTVLFFCGAWPRRRSILATSGTGFLRLIGKLLTSILIGLGIICLFWDRLAETDRQQSGNQPYSQGINTVTEK